MIYLRRRLENRDQSGMSLIELLIAMSLMMIILSLVLTVFVSSVRTQRDLQGAGTSISAAQNLSIQFTKSVRTAQQLRVTSGSRLDLKNADGYCQAWVVSGDTLYTRTATATTAAVPAFTSATGWRKALSPIAQVSTGAYFTVRDQIGVQYSISSGVDLSNIDMVGSSKPRVVTGTSSPCW